MGTDIYLRYDGQDMEKEGYWQEGNIRASIGMVNENYILRQIFPPECWEEEKNNFFYVENVLTHVQKSQCNSYYPVCKVAVFFPACRK